MATFSLDKASPHSKCMLHDEEDPRVEVPRIALKCGTSKCLSLIACVLGVIGLLVALVVFVFVPERRLQQVLGAEVDTKAFACIPCTKLLHDPADNVSSDPFLQKLHIQVKDGRKMCCAYTAEQVTALFESVMRLNNVQYHHLPSYNFSDFKFSPVSAHKRLYPARISDDFHVPKFGGSPQVCRLKVHQSGYGLEHCRGVKISKDGLTIVHGGFYYIYVSLQFRPQSKHPCSDFRYQTFAAYVQKFSRQPSWIQMSILKLVNTCCDRCTNFQETSSTGGVFALEPGDEIKVKVSGYEVVHFEPETSFLGLAMLASSESDSDPLN
ncbi:hypothetical protein RRG08_066356 [Elysia crispata]|uniref:THD domain-containing protein n=1 Tax=Elysia crispata TaxID=231223 RepID=A0AAE1CVB1_9GAST|nr:hypothetical protein RRG08_066356 [Elysia crispata]